MSKRFVLFLLLIPLSGIFISTYGQDINLGVGEWRTHLSFENGEVIEEVEDRIYSGTMHGLFYVNKSDNSIHSLSPIDGFSGISVTAMRYHSPSRQLFIAYQNGMIDIIKSNKSITTLSAIANENLIGNVRINDITFFNRKAYMSSTFGVAVYDLREEQFSATFFGPRNPKWYTQDIAMLNDTFYVSTENGLLKAPTTSVNLQDINNWKNEKTDSFGELVNYSGRLYFQDGETLMVRENNSWDSVEGIQFKEEIDFHVDNKLLFISRSSQNSIQINPDGTYEMLESQYANRTLIDEKGNIWTGQSGIPLLKRVGNNLNFYKPNGPSSSSTWSLTYKHNSIYLTGGSITPNFSASYNISGFYLLNPDGRWQNYSYIDNQELRDRNLLDFLNIAVAEDYDHFYAASFTNGLVEFKNGEFFKHYTPANSALGYVASVPNDSLLRVADLKFDEDNNLWITNNNSAEPLVVKTTEGGWHNFRVGSYDNFLDLEIDDYGQIWIRTHGNGLIVYDKNGTIANSQDDRFTQLTQRGGQGGLPTNTVLCLEKDKEGNMWIGTSDGVAVYYSPSEVFDRPVNAQQVFIDQGNESGLFLSGESVTSIEVDGGNYKWFGTASGVWYTNPDVDRILKRFDTDNSPLLSDEINDIVVNDQTGEVFFATNEGLVSYRGEATEGGEKHNNVYAFPNPVNPDYSGPITIKGLVTNAQIKITNAQGNLVNEINAKGGQAVWNGKNLRNNKVSSGVYYVYSSNEDGSETMVTKILIVQ